MDQPAISPAQRAQLTAILLAHPVLGEVLRRSPALELGDYCVGAGAVCQSVWNAQEGLPPLHGISDVDLVYFDPDLSYEKEDRVIHRVQEAFRDLPVAFDVKNQARVHLWYRDHFGSDIAPYPSLEGAIATWPTTATAVGVRLEGEGLKIIAPFGLDDLFGRIVRPNKVQITEAIYRSKWEKWQRRWTCLTVIPW